MPGENPALVSMHYLHPNLINVLWPKPQAPLQIPSLSQLYEAWSSSGLWSVCVKILQTQSGCFRSFFLQQRSFSRVRIHWLFHPSLHAAPSLPLFRVSLHRACWEIWEHPAIFYINSPCPWVPQKAMKKFSEMHTCHRKTCLNICFVECPDTWALFTLFKWTLKPQNAWMPLH